MYKITFNLRLALRRQLRIHSSCHGPAQFDEEEDAELAAQLAVPKYKRTWLLKICISLAISAAVLIAGITVCVVAPQTVRSLVDPICRDFGISSTELRLQSVSYFDTSVAVRERQLHGVALAGLDWLLGASLLDGEGPGASL